jgi:hypothetical protein
VGDTTLAAEANRLLFTYAVARPMCAPTLRPADVPPISNVILQLHSANLVYRSAL